MSFLILNNPLEPDSPKKEPKEQFSERELEIQTEKLHFQTEVEFESIELKPHPLTPNKEHLKGYIKK